MNLSDKKTIEKLLNENGFLFKKSLGQNFICDPTVCPAMAESAADKETGVLEIGPGFGVLTVECARVAKKVVAVELDRRLEKVLATTLADTKNTNVIFADAMKLDLALLIKEQFSDCKKVAVCANLPYYITSPLIMRLLSLRLPVDNLTVMVQKEAADRLCATVGTREAGAVSVAVQFYAEPEVLFTVPSTSFIPSPKVDSAVIRLNVRETPPVTVNSEENFFRLVKACFAQRRKTLCNTVCNTLGLSKDTVKGALISLGLDEAVRSEKLTMSQLAALCDLLF